MFLVFMRRVLVFMGTVLAGVLMVMDMGTTGMGVLMGMFKEMLMRMGVLMLVRMNHLLMGMLMTVFGVSMLVHLSFTSVDMPVSVLMAVHVRVFVGV